MNKPDRLKASVTKGFTLIEVIVAMGIFTIIALATSSMMVTLSRTHAAMDIKLERLELRQVIVSNIDCASSMTAICDLGRQQLISSNRSIAIHDVGYEGGEKARSPKHWLLKPHCDAGALYVDARLMIGDEPAMHPITKEPWQWQPLFANGICRQKSFQTKSCLNGKTVRWVDFANGEIGCGR